MKPMFRSKIEVDRKKESKYNPIYDMSDYDDMDWREYIAYRKDCFQKAENFLKRARIIK